MPNLLQQPPQPQPQGMQMAPSITPQLQQQPPTPEQIQDAHAHLSDMQKMLDELIKKPDSELSRSAIYGAAADMITKNRLTKGKMGISAIDAARELSSPDFPKQEDGPKEIRKFLQKYFDRAILNQAAISAKLGPPQSPQSQPQQNMPPSPPNQLQAPQ